jgi:DNA-binding response OmpR family regulator
MAKILLVEDDVNLREIYSARFAAEAYEVITASDGEEALATAVRERPDLIVLDVMMPKISGFDVLDILRSTPETKDTKVIMMTALSQDADRKRGESLGANKYLIKSQVTLEDVVNSVKEELGGTPGSAVPQAAPATPPPPPATG